MSEFKYITSGCSSAVVQLEIAYQLKRIADNGGR